MSFQQCIDSAIKEKEIFFIGEKLPSDWYEGFILWEKIAQTGDPKALFNIAYCYFTGEGTSKDINKAIQCYEKSAQNGFPDAYYHIYNKLKNIDEKTALECLEKGVINGSLLSKQCIENARSTYQYHEKWKIYDKYYTAIQESISKNNTQKIKNVIAKAKQEGVGDWFEEIEYGIQLKAKIYYQTVMKQSIKDIIYHSDGGSSHTYNYDCYDKCKVKLYNPTNKPIEYWCLNELGIINPKQKKTIYGITHNASSGCIQVNYTIYQKDNRRYSSFSLPNQRIKKIYGIFSKILKTIAFFMIIIMIVRCNFHI